MEREGSEEGDMRLLACPYCNSLKLTKRMLFAGPLPFVDNDDGSYRCNSCGMVAVPTEFSTLEEYQNFIGAAPDEETKMHVLPLVPLDFVKGRQERRRVIKVRSLSWQEGRLQRGEEDVGLADYWRALTGVYGTREVALLDLVGVMEHRPDLQGLQEAMKRKREVWVDLGLADEQDVLDGFTMGVERLLALSLGVPDLGLFAKVISISDRVVPCLCYDGKVRWGKRRKGASGELNQTLLALRQMGYSSVAVLDLRRLGGDQPDLRFLEEVLSLWPGAILGGGLRQEHVPWLTVKGAGGGLLEPYAAELRAALAGSAPVDRRGTEY